MGAGDLTGAPVTEKDRDMALASRMDRLKQDQMLLAMLLGQDGESRSGFGGAFGPGTASDRADVGAG